MPLHTRGAVQGVPSVPQLHPPLTHMLARAGRQTWHGVPPSPHASTVSNRLHVRPEQHPSEQVPALQTPPPPTHACVAITQVPPPMVQFAQSCPAVPQRLLSVPVWHVPLLPPWQQPVGQANASHTQPDTVQCRLPVHGAPPLQPHAPLDRHMFT